MKFTKSLVAGGTCLLAGVLTQNVSADAVWDVKTDQTKNDIADAANWAQKPLDNDNKVEFANTLNPAASSLWIGSDHTFKRLYISAKGDIPFNLGAGKTLTIDGDNLQMHGQNSAMTLSSGTIMSSGGNIYVGPWGNNSSKFVVTGSDSKIIQRGGQLFVGGVAANGRNEFRVENGAVADLEYIRMPNNYSNGGNNTITISGENTYLYCTNAIQNVEIGGQNSGNTNNVFCVKDNATFVQTQGSFCLGTYGNSVNNAAEFLNGANVSLKEVFVGWINNSRSNVLRSVNSTLTISQAFKIGNGEGASHNTMEISGGSLSVGAAFTVGAAAGNSSLILKDGAKFAFGAWGCEVGKTDNSHSNKVEVLSGAEMSWTGGDFRLGQSGMGNTMIVDDATVLATKNAPFYVGNNATSKDNTLIIRNNGYVHAEKLCFGSVGGDNTLVMSNGVLEAHSGDQWKNLYFPIGGSSSNNTIVISGTNSVIRNVEAEMLIRQATTLEFVIPYGGYTEIPFQTTNGGKQIRFTDDTTKIKLDLTAFAKSGGGKQVIARAAGGIQISDAALANLNAQLAEQRCSLFVKDNQLILKTPSTRGFSIVIR